MSKELKVILLFGAAIVSFFVNDAITGTIIAIIGGGNALSQIDESEPDDYNNILIFAAILNGISLIYNVTFFF